MCVDVEIVMSRPTLCHPPDLRVPLSVVGPMSVALMPSTLVLSELQISFVGYAVGPFCPVRLSLSKALSASIPASRTSKPVASV